MSQNQLSMDSLGANSFPGTPRDFNNKMPHEIDCVSKIKKAFVLFNRREMVSIKNVSSVQFCLIGVFFRWVVKTF